MMSRPIPKLHEKISPWNNFYCNRFADSLEQREKIDRLKKAFRKLDRREIHKKDYYTNLSHYRWYNRTYPISLTLLKQNHEEEYLEIFDFVKENSEESYMKIRQCSLRILKDRYPEEFKEILNKKRSETKTESEEK